nr:MAG TPA: hypothetical protein [Caudoviricetes sp.]
MHCIYDLRTIGDTDYTVCSLGGWGESATLSV